VFLADGRLVASCSRRRRLRARTRKEAGRLTCGRPPSRLARAQAAAGPHGLAIVSRHVRVRHALLTERSATPSRPVRHVYQNVDFQSARRPPSAGPTGAAVANPSRSHRRYCQRRPGRRIRRWGGDRLRAVRRPRWQAISTGERLRSGLVRSESDAVVSGAGEGRHRRRPTRSPSTKYGTEVPLRIGSRCASCSSGRRRLSPSPDRAVRERRKPRRSHHRAFNLPTAQSCSAEVGRYEPLTSWPNLVSTRRSCRARSPRCYRPECSGHGPDGSQRADSGR